MNLFFLNKRELTDCLTGGGQHQGWSNKSKNSKQRQLPHKDKEAEKGRLVQLQTPNKTQLKPIREGQPIAESGAGTKTGSSKCGYRRSRK